MPDTMTAPPPAESDTPPRDVPLSFHHRAVAMRLNEMFERGEFERLNLERKKALRTAILCIEQLGDLADDEVRGARADERGRRIASSYDIGTRDGATIERNRILGLPWWKRALGRVG